MNQKASSLDYAEAKPSERKALREIFEAFGRIIPPELHATGDDDCDGEYSHCFTPDEATSLLAELAGIIEMPIDGGLHQGLLQALCSLPHLEGNALEIFGIHYCTELMSRLQDAASRGKGGDITLQASRLCALAQETHGDKRFSPWCDLKAFFGEFDRLTNTPDNRRSESDRDRLKFLKSVSETGLMRRRGTIPDPATLMKLVEIFPNFSGPVRFIAEQAALARLRNDSCLSLQPILLGGPPGVGKTHFAGALAEALGAQCEKLDMAAQSCGFTLAGLDRGWSSARTGLVFETLRHGQRLDPIIVLEELDKTNDDSRSDPLGPLYALLEPRSARTFRDEYAGFSINAAQIVWVATANETSRIPAPLRSRFKVFEIEAPDEEQGIKIADKLFCTTLAGIPGAPAAMPVGWKLRLRGKPPREIQAAVKEALGRAALRASSKNLMRIEVLDEDLLIAEPGSHRRIGF